MNINLTQPNLFDEEQKAGSDQNDYTDKTLDDYSFDSFKNVDLFDLSRRSSSTESKEAKQEAKLFNVLAQQLYDTSYSNLSRQQKDSLKEKILTAQSTNRSGTLFTESVFDKLKELTPENVDSPTIAVPKKPIIQPTSSANNFNDIINQWDGTDTAQINFDGGDTIEKSEIQLKNYLLNYFKNNGITDVNTQKEQLKKILQNLDTNKNGKLDTSEYTYDTWESPEPRNGMMTMVIYPVKRLNPLTVNSALLDDTAKTTRDSLINKWDGKAQTKIDFDNNGTIDPQETNLQRYLIALFARNNITDINKQKEFLKDIFNDLDKNRNGTLEVTEYTYQDPSNNPASAYGNVDPFAVINSLIFYRPFIYQLSNVYTTVPSSKEKNN